MILFSLFVQAADGLVFGVVPFVSRRLLGVVNGMTGAGGSACAVLTQYIFFSGSLGRARGPRRRSTTAKSGRRRSATRPGLNNASVRFAENCGQEAGRRVAARHTVPVESSPIHA
ncbi:hypothetical protein EJB05_17290, partial [Eragrostis curvula]